MISKTDPWYVHAGLYTVILVLIYILIQVAIIQPKEIVAWDKYYKEESRARMKNIKEAEILYQKKFGIFTNNMDTLVNFIYSPFVDSVRNSYDTLLRRSNDPFINLAHGAFSPESLFRTPRSQKPFILEIDTTTNVDTVVTPSGRILRVDTNIVIGSRYRLEDPDGNGTIGDLHNDALKNTASWE